MTQKYNFLLPAYKPDFFKEALDSILGQTYRDFKLIILDDCSPYDLKSIVDEYDDDRITYYRNEENMGGKSLVACWNKLLGLADSEYIILASDDDVYEVNFLEEMDRLARKYPKVDLLRARVRLINEKGETLAKDALYEEKVTSLEFIAQLYNNYYIKCIANFVFKCNSLKKNGGFVEFPLAWHSDSATAIMQSLYGLVNSETILFSFRSSSVNISYGKNGKRKSYSKIEAAFLYNDWLNLFLNSFRTESNSIYEKSLFSSIKRNQGNCMVLELYTYVSGVSCSKLFRILRKTKSFYINLNCLYLFLKGNFCKK